jgi:hypothetical protein
MRWARLAACPAYVAKVPLAADHVFDLLRAAIITLQLIGVSVVVARIVAGIVARSVIDVRIGSVMIRIRIGHPYTNAKWPDLHSNLCLGRG